MHRHGGAGPAAHGLPLPEHQPLRGELPQDGGQAAGVGEAQPADPRHQLGKETPRSPRGGSRGTGRGSLRVSIVVIHCYLVCDPMYNSVLVLVAPVVCIKLYLVFKLNIHICFMLYFYPYTIHEINF